MQRDISKVGWAGYLGVSALIICFGGYLAMNRPGPAPAPVKFVDEAPSQSPATAPNKGEEKVSPLSTSSEVVIHITGAVKVHGLLHMPGTARVDDAIRKAGGATADADLDSINLAAKLVDGSQLRVPRKNESQSMANVDAAYQAGNNPAYSSDRVAADRPGESKAAAGAKKSPSGPVSLNTASAVQLQSLPGVGPSTAQKILQYRQEHGGFSSVDELLAVKGIGPKKLKEMRRFLRL